MICTHCFRKAPTAGVCSVCGRTQRSFIPDLDEIEQGKEEIQSGWTSSDRENRARGPFGKRGSCKPEHWTVPVIRIADIIGAEFVLRDVIE